MKVILKKDVRNIGKKHDIKEVSNGHALNFLIPNNLAIVATDAQIKKIEIVKAGEEAQRKIKENLLAKNLKDVGSINIKIAEKTNDKGHLFSGIHKERIAEEIKKQTGLDISPEFMNLDKPLKEVGDHKITVSVSGKSTQFVVSVASL